MRKTLKIVSLSAMVIMAALILTQCKKDDTKVGKVSGIVSMEDGTLANGAIVTLSSGANGTDVITRVVADEAGVYAIPGVNSGTYYVNARWEPSNTNNLEKSAGTVILSGVEQEVSVDGEKIVDIVLSGSLSGGSVVFDAEEWNWDNTHSTIGFEFPYDAFNAVFSGHFASVGIDELIFDEANPENSSIKAWVDVTSVETGAASPPCARGRDGITGCIGGSFGVDLDQADTVDASCVDGSVVTDWPNEEPVEIDLWGDGSPTTYMRQSAVIGKTGVATFKSTSIKAYGTGYIATGEFSFAGTTSTVNLYFNYLEGYLKENDDSGVQYSSFYGWFKFAALADHGVSSSHIGDADVTVKLSVQFNKPV